jgi:hypothetical protein
VSWWSLTPSANIIIIIIIIPSSHSINAIGPAPHRSGNNREHCSVMLVIILHIPSLNKILSNTPGKHSTHPNTTLFFQVNTVAVTAAAACCRGRLHVV